EIGMTQISEILPFAGADLVGPLPADIQLYTSFAGANSAAAKQPDGGKAFFKFLVTPETAKVMKAKGLEPAGWTPGLSSCATVIPRSEMTAVTPSHPSPSAGADARRAAA